MTLMPGMTFIQRLRHRPFEHAVAAIMLITAIISFVMFGGVIGSQLPPWLNVPWIIANLAGGTLVFMGLHWRGSPIMARALEQVGWLTGAITMTAVAVAVLYFTGGAAWIRLIDELILVTAAVLRGWFLHRERKAERVAVRLLMDNHKEDD